jgi:hypothetical protein
MVVFTTPSPFFSILFLRYFTFIFRWTWGIFCGRLGLFEITNFPINLVIMAEENEIIGSASEFIKGEFESGMQPTTVVMAIKRLDQ